MPTSDHRPDRRAWLQWAGAGLGALVPMAAAAQGARSRGPLGLPIPPQLTGLIPTQAVQGLRIVEQLIALEREADVRRLPQSLLSGFGSGELPTDPDQLYLVALPRLVALIDRSDRAAPGLADRAGLLLAELNGGQREMPAGLRFDSGPAPGIDGGAATVDAPDIAFPPVALPTAPPPMPVDPVVTAPASLSRSTRFADLAEEYDQLFASAALRPEREQPARWHLTMLGASRRRYEAVSARTGVPWYFVGAVHGLEASFNFRGHLHNGDAPLSARTRQVPAGRPLRWAPPSDWESSAIDALRLMGFADQADWSLPRTLHRLEAYNGFGYRGRGVPSPYLWSFTQHYSRGKFVADGRWNPNAGSQQCGAATMLKLLADDGIVRL